MQLGLITALIVRPLGSNWYVIADVRLRRQLYTMFFCDFDGLHAKNKNKIESSDRATDLMSAKGGAQTHGQGKNLG